MTGISECKSDLFQDLRVVAHQHAKLAYDQEHPLLQSSLERLGAFHSSLNTRISELQHEKVTIPTKEALEEEREKNLIAYWGFRGTAHKAQMLAREFSVIVAFLTPQSRLYLNEDALGNEAPELLETLNTCDKASKTLMSEASDWWGKMDTLQTKMFEKLDNEVSYSIQKFCQIVGSEGKPLGTIMRAVDYCTTPFVPKPQVKELKIEEPKSDPGTLEGTAQTNPT